MRRLTVPVVLLALAGCAGSGMDEAECQTADWRAVGYEDGAKGYGADAFGRHRKACAEHGIVANFDAYLNGHGEGLAVFCRPRNGYNLGQSGKRYSGICPAHLEPAFVEAHRDGYGLYERRSALSRIGSQLRRSRARAKEIEHLMAERTALLVAPDVLPADRAAIAVEIKQLTEEKIDIGYAIDDLEGDYAEAEEDYRAYRSRLDQRYRG